MERKEGAPYRPPNPALPYREDCWSEGETSALVYAWGDRYLDLNRGNLRQKHWQEVADAVNSRRGAAGRRPPRTDVQCKNRIDTLKKKYKIEKGRIASGSVVAVSQWPFFSRLDTLIGSSVAAVPTAHSVKKRAVSPPLALALPYHRKGAPLPVATSLLPLDLKEKRPTATALAVDDSIFWRAATAAAAAEEDDEEEEEEAEAEAEAEEDVGSPSGSSERRCKRALEREGNEIRELARAIERFSDIYESVEVAKQQQMMEMEKQRMEFDKELEFQRMQMFVDLQVQLAKIKRTK